MIKRQRVGSLVAANVLMNAYRVAGWNAFVVSITDDVFEVRAHKAN